MSLYTTPLQIGYFFSLLLWIVLLIRGHRDQRLSDKLLGWTLFILAMELQDYTFGFAGINVLWNELNGFPRGVGLLFGPVIYLYFRAQVNRSFTIKRADLIHFVPYSLYFLYEISAFVQGPEAVLARQESGYTTVMAYILRISLWASYGYYLVRCLSIYRKYKRWSINQFSNTEIIDFSWFRNFILAMSFWLLFREVMNVLDAFLDLDFYQDWWWNLALVGVAIYIGLAGFSQRQPAKINFETAVDKADTKKHLSQADNPTVTDPEKNEIAHRLSQLMKEDRLFLQPDLNLQELALHLQTNTVQLSATINQLLNQNFNDYVNSLRIEEFIRLSTLDAHKKYTMLSVALDSGFNSKATFNRAFKKIKGCSPKAYFDQLQSLNT